MHRFAEFCPEAPKHVGQPPVFVDDSDDDDNDPIPDEEWHWPADMTGIVLRPFVM